MKNLKVSLAWQILLAMVLGILLGSYLHYHSDSREWLIANLLSPAGDIFIHLIKMIVVPIVISTLIVGIAGVGDAKQLGRIGAKTILDHHGGDYPRHYAGECLSARLRH